ncbi:MAG: dTDP-4-dehydrorhamnose reductase [Chloroflexota bacterium]|nr:dTDP-4-dehydrorhamnose reductase [Chloroflexota bacterium]
MSPRLDGTRVLLTGAGGQLGRYLTPALADAGATVIGAGSHARPGADRIFDITDEKSVRAAFDAESPAIVIHAAAFTDVDGAERDEAAAHAVNVVGSRHVARAAAAAGAHLIGVGTDFIFAGDGGAPYDEMAPALPLSVYGRTKLEGEQAIMSANPAFAVARTAWLYGGSGKHFPRTVLCLLRDRGTIAVVDDECGSPTFAGDLAVALVQLAAQRAAGTYHLVNEGRASRFGLARAVAEAAAFRPEGVTPTTSEEFLAHYPLPARRPADSTLVNRRAAALGVRLPPWRDAIERYVPALAAELNLAPANGEE